MQPLMNPVIIGNLLLTLLGLLFVFHLLVMAGIVPYGIVWAGKLKNRQQMLRMEAVSVLVLLLAVTLVLLRMNYLQWIDNSLILKGGMWLLFAFFSLNTLGNMTAKSPFEKYGFGSLTLLLAICCLVLALY
jgi:hypothetical protein